MLQIFLKTFSEVEIKSFKNHHLKICEEIAWFACFHVKSLNYWKILRQNLFKSHICVRKFRMVRIFVEIHKIQL